MNESDKGTYFQPQDWLQLWSTAVHDWQRAYSWAWDGFAQRAEQMPGMRGGPALAPDALMNMGSRMMENWAAAMRAMSGGRAMPGAMSMASGIDMPGSATQQQIGACVTQAYLATGANLLRWWMRVGQSWADYARTSASRVAGGGSDPSTLGVLADETRAQLRKVADITVEEASTMQRQMEQFAEQIRTIIDPGAPDREPQRRARTKP